MLVQTMAMCFVLTLMALLCCGSYLVERMREYISLSLPRTGVNGFIMQAPEVHVHPSVSCLILLINTVDILILWNLVSSWCRRKQLSGEAILNCALRHLLPGGRVCGRIWAGS